MTDWKRSDSNFFFNLGNWELWPMEEIVQAKLDICEIFKQNISLNRKKNRKRQTSPLWQEQVHRKLVCVLADCGTENSGKCYFIDF